MLDWLTTLPGILIICGVILLLIAVILFILGNKKSKKGPVNSGENIENTSTEVTTNSVESVPVTPAVTEEVNTPAVEQVAAVAETPSVAVTEPVQEPVVEQSQNNAAIDEFVNALNAEPTQENIVEPTIETPSFENVESVQPEMPSFGAVGPIQIETPTEEPTEPVQVTEPEVSFDIPTAAPVEIQPAEEPKPYGGVDPMVSISIPEEKTTTIYGGNDPLEKTQSIPKVEEVHQPYNIEPEIKVVEPTIEPMVEQQPFSMPSVEPVSTFEPTPVEINPEPVVQIPVQPVEDINKSVEEL